MEFLSLDVFKGGGPKQPIHHFALRTELDDHKTPFANQA